MQTLFFLFSFALCLLVNPAMAQHFAENTPAVTDCKQTCKSTQNDCEAEACRAEGCTKKCEKKRKKMQRKAKRKNKE